MAYPCVVCGIKIHTPLKKVLKQTTIMTINRKEFFMKACLAGTCLCGFLPLSSQKPDLPEIRNPEEPEDKNRSFMQEWISTLMLSLDEQADKDVARQIMKKCARAHYDQLKMDEVLQVYVGNLKKFIQFLKSNWNWVITFDEEKQIVLADENKDVCVCPLVNQDEGVKSAVLCYCSEGFAELMFSKVAGKPAEARIISSIHRGNDRCKYEIKLT
jgi:predicted hydrocarbon binding protein